MASRAAWICALALGLPTFAFSEQVKMDLAWVLHVVANQLEERYATPICYEEISSYTYAPNLEDRSAPSIVQARRDRFLPERIEAPFGALNFELPSGPLPPAALADLLQSILEQHAKQQSRALQALAPL